jgi:hypothetical protein
MDMHGVTPRGDDKQQSRNYLTIEPFGLFLCITLCLTTRRSNGLMQRGTRCGGARKSVLAAFIVMPRHLRKGGVAVKNPGASSGALWGGPGYLLPGRAQQATLYRAIHKALPVAVGDPDKQVVRATREKKPKQASGISTQEIKAFQLLAERDEKVNGHGLIPTGNGHLRSLARRQDNVNFPSLNPLYRQNRLKIEDTQAF